MEINKLEQKLKAQFKKRQIEPSAGSWEKLNARLAAENHRAANRNWWLGAAVAAVAAISLSLFVFDQNNLTSPAIVEEPVKEERKTPSQEEQFKTPVEIASEENEEEFLKASGESKQLTGVTEEAPASEEKESDSEVIVFERIVLSPPLENIYNEALSDEIDEIIATVDKREENGTEVSDAEIDALLAEATAAISEREKILKKSTGISSESLLAEVEDEIFQSFKEKVFLVLKGGLLKARTAVANRNN